MLPEALITLMAERSARGLVGEGAVSGDRAKLVRTIRRAIKEEMNVAEALEVDADKIIKAHLVQVRSEGADVGRLREQILATLAKERGLVLK